MAGIQEKLRSLYDKPRPDAHSWIPKKVTHSPLEELKRTLPQERTLSPKRASDLMGEQALLSGIKMNVFELVVEYLETERKEVDLEVNFANFLESWEELFDRHGPIMVLALNELLEEMKFISPDGHIRKSVLNKMIRKLEKEAKNQ